jgi:hypothetical protein
MERLGMRYARDITVDGDPFVLCELGAADAGRLSDAGWPGGQLLSVPAY